MHLLSSISPFPLKGAAQKYRKPLMRRLERSGGCLHRHWSGCGLTFDPTNQIPPPPTMSPYSVPAVKRHLRCLYAGAVKQPSGFVLPSAVITSPMNAPFKSQTVLLHLWEIIHKPPGWKAASSLYRTGRSMCQWTRRPCRMASRGSLRASSQRVKSKTRKHNLDPISFCEGFLHWECIN